MMADEVGRQLHFAATVVDGHSDVFCDVADRRLKGETHVLDRLHVPAWREGGVNVVLTTLYVEEEHKPDRALRRAMTLLGAALNDIAETPDVALCKTRAEIDAALGREQIAFVLGIEGGECIQDGIESLRVFYELGARVLGLTWNQRNLLAEGVGEERAAGGITERGRAMVAEADRLGVLLDVSHLSIKSFWDLMETGTGTIIASHSNAKALCGHRRNLDDDQLRAVAQRGGTIGINMVASFLTDDPKDANLERLLDHVDYIAEIVGVENIAIGPDFVDYLDFGHHDAVYAADLPTISALPLLTDGLVRRGYGEPAIRGILGENFLRVLGNVMG
jgi:membrane dipeptidase